MRRFPVQDHNVYGLRNGLNETERGDLDRPIESVPWEIVETLRVRCMRIHTQTIDRLAERGGLGLLELWAHWHWDGRSTEDFWKLLETEETPDDLREWARSLGALP